MNVANEKRRRLKAVKPGPSPLPIPDNAKWIAQDKSGHIYAYLDDSKPEADENQWNTDGAVPHLVYYGARTNPGFQSTLVEASTAREWDNSQVAVHFEMDYYVSNADAVPAQKPIRVAGLKLSSEFMDQFDTAQLRLLAEQCASQNAWDTLRIENFIVYVRENGEDQFNFHLPGVLPDSFPESVLISRNELIEWFGNNSLETKSILCAEKDVTNDRFAVELSDELWPDDQSAAAHGTAVHQEAESILNQLANDESGDDTIDFDDLEKPASLGNDHEAELAKRFIKEAEREKSRKGVWNAENQFEDQAPVLHAIGYEDLADVLKRAFDQASTGKGKERHATDMPFELQPMQQISDLLNSPLGMSHQAIKKIVEGLNMDDTDKCVRELLGAIVYISGIVIWKEKRHSVPYESGDE